MYNRMLKLITEAEEEKTFTKKLRDFWNSTRPKKDRREAGGRARGRSGRGNNQGPPGPNRAFGTENPRPKRKSTTLVSKNSAEAAKGGGQTTGSKAAGWIVQQLNRKKQIGPVMS